MLKICAAAGMLLLPAVATAGTDQGWYVSGAVGPSFAGALQSSQLNTRINPDAGVVGQAAVGYRLGHGLRLELEGSYRSNGVESILTHRVTGAMHSLSQIEGDVAAPAAMANLAYDLPIHPFGLPVRPYVGGGIGHAWFDAGDLHGVGLGIFNLPQHNTFTGPDNVQFGTGGAFAYQAMAGVSWPVRRVRGLELTAEYRFFGSALANTSVTRTALGGVLVNNTTPVAVSSNGFEIHDNEVLLGVRYSFGAR